jgi:pilus assembly protein Flp/PilA
MSSGKEVFLGPMLLHSVVSVFPGLLHEETLSMKKLFKKWWKGEKGVTAIEYGLLAALIALALVAGATLTGTGLNTIFTNIGNFLTGAPVPGA